MLIALFLSGLFFFSYRSPLGVSSFSFKNNTNESLPNFPVKAKLKIISSVTRAKSITTLEELFADRTELLVNFWATWCPPCLEELPSLDYLSRQLNLKENKSSPLLVTISVDEDYKEVSKLFKTLEFSTELLVLHDPDGEISMRMGTTKFPETYLINKEGKVLKKWIGPQNWLSGNIIRNLTLNSSH